MENDLKSQERVLSEDVSNLGKKAKYLEKQLNEAQSQLKDIVSLRVLIPTPLAAY